MNGEFLIEPNAESNPAESNPVESNVASHAGGFDPGPHSNSDSPALPEDTRRELISRFERWLDAAAAGDAAPDGLPAELVDEVLAGPSETPEADLYTLFSAMTSLKGEIGLQGRSFKQLTDALQPVGVIPARIAALEAAGDRAAGDLGQLSAMVARLAMTDERSSTGLPDAKDALSVLFDLQARLERGLESFDESVEAIEAAEATAKKPGFLARLFGAKETAADVDLDAMREGYQLTLARLEGALRQWGIERVGEIGEPFEPGCMQAVEVAPAADVDEGTILEVYRSGYVSHGRVLETAKVKVAKRG